jgi:hypothetical protein
MGFRGTKNARTLIGTIIVCIIANGIFLRSSLQMSSGDTSCIHGNLDLPLQVLTSIGHQNSSPCLSFCECFQRWTLVNSTKFIPTASSLWHRHESELLRSSFRDDEAENHSAVYRDWVTSLFAQATPERLHKSIETLPSLGVIQGLLQKKTPIQIAVFGGSLTAGHGCLTNPVGLPSASFMKHQLPCAWPSRLQQLLDDFVGGNQISISNMAMAATTSDVGATVVEYQLYPPGVQPDIILASFATNDALSEATPETIYQNMQSLIVAVQRESNCHPQKLPLLVYVDDFIAWPGNLTQWMRFHKDLHELAEWHNIMMVSYANSFRQLAQQDLIADVTFKGKWKWQHGNPVADPHPGMSFHILMAWTVLYNILHLLLEACGGPSAEVSQLPPRPPLRADLTTEGLAERWNESGVISALECAVRPVGARCAFVWVANRVSQFRSSQIIADFLKRYLISNQDWKAEGNSYKSKHGWVAKERNATFILAMTLESPVRYVTILSLKSYGDAWKDSRLHLHVGNKSFEMLGSHSSKTSVIIPHKFDLGLTIVAGLPLKLIFRLVGGSTFKITGMAFCSV